MNERYIQKENIQNVCLKRRRKTMKKKPKKKNQKKFKLVNNIVINQFICPHVDYCSYQAEINGK